MPLDSPLVAEARDLAQLAHAAQRRKASGAPYFSHLDAVARSLAAHGYDDDIILSAAYLHDLLEDQPTFEQRFRSTMPTRVIEVVEALTERKYDDSGIKRPKGARFDDYLEGLTAASGTAALAVPISCADRIHNTQSIVDDEAAGFSPFMQLVTRPGELRQQLARLRVVYAPTVNSRLLATFDATAERLEQTIERWLPGRAAMIAASAHLGQFDKAGNPYIFHPMKLALDAGSAEERCVALLHDVLEDTPVTLEELRREGFGAAVLRAIEHLTKQDGESYDEFIERVARHRLATRVKLLDLAHNADLSRLPAPTPEDHERVHKYRRAMQRLQAELGRRSLYVVLDSESQQRARDLATLAVVKADHVTLARRVDPTTYDASWVQGAAGAGAGSLPQTVQLVATHRVRSMDIEALVVELAGSRVRPHDGGTLHLTLSRSPTARSKDANTLLASGDWEPLQVALSGSAEWVDD